jgi:hypothetical protein
MSRRTFSCGNLAAAADILYLVACAQNPPAAVAPNPPPVAPGPNIVWYTVDFDTANYAIDANGQKIVDQAIVSRSATQR